MKLKTNDVTFSHVGPDRFLPSGELWPGASLQLHSAPLFFCFLVQSTASYSLMMMQ